MINDDILKKSVPKILLVFKNRNIENLPDRWWDRKDLHQGLSCAWYKFCGKEGHDGYRTTGWNSYGSKILAKSRSI